MTDGAFKGAFPHQHGDPRSLIDRIDAQIQERIEEAIELAALSLMVELRKLQHRPAPESASPQDRAEFESGALDLLRHLRDSFRAELPADQRSAFEQSEASGADERARILRGQVLLARRLPDYWQRFEAHRAAHEQARRAMPAPKPGFMSRLFRGA